MAFNNIDTTGTTHTLKAGMDIVNGNFDTLEGSGGAAEIGTAAPWTGSTVQSVLATVYNDYPTSAILAATTGAALIGGDSSGLTYSTGSTIQAILADLDTAIGTGGSVGALDDLTDVIITTPATGHILRYNGTYFVNTVPTSTVNELDDLTDVSLTTPVIGNILLHNGSQFVNVPSDYIFTEIGAPVSSVSVEYNAITASVVELPTTSGDIRLYAMTDCFICFSTSFDPYNCIYMSEGTEIFGITTETHLTVKGVSSSGLLSITGLDTDNKPGTTTTAVIPVQAGSTAAALPSGPDLRLFAMTDCFIAFGDNTVTASNSDTFFAAGTEMLGTPAGTTHIAVKRYSINGGLYVTGLS